MDIFVMPLGLSDVVEGSMAALYIADTLSHGTAIRGHCFKLAEAAVALSYLGCGASNSLVQETFLASAVYQNGWT